MKRTLAIIGAVALLAWTGLGLVAWTNVARHVDVTFSDEERNQQGSTQLLALADELGTLHQDVRALARNLGENLQALSDELAAAQDEHAAAIELQVAALREEAGSRISPSSSPEELAGLLRELRARLDATVASSAPGSAAQFVPPAELEAAAQAPVEPAAEPASVAAAETAAPAPRARRSFLAFQLPSDDFRFDERRTWAVLPALSRVGFDAKTTLHDFSGVTSSIEGELEADLSKPGEKPRARLEVQAAALATGDEDRDEAMREHLSVSDHATILFELASFEPGKLDAAALRAEGTAHGRLTVRGVTREVTMPVKISIDDARRMCVEGEMKLDLEEFGVPVPNKLGLITMEKEVKVWLSLRLRANPHTEG